MDLRKKKEQAMKKAIKLSFVHEINDKCIILFRHQNAEQLRNTKAENQSSENVGKSSNKT
jgi:hypothetical protein